MGGYIDGLRGRLASLNGRPRCNLGDCGPIDKVGSLLADPHHVVGGQVSAGIPRRDSETAWGAEIDRVGS